MAERQPWRDEDDNPAVPTDTQMGGTRSDTSDEQPDLDAAGEVATQADALPRPTDPDTKARGSRPRNPTRHPRRTGG